MSVWIISEKFEKKNVSKVILINCFSIDFIVLVLDLRQIRNIRRKVVPNGPLTSIGLKLQVSSSHFSIVFTWCIPDAILKGIFIGR